MGALGGNARLALDTLEMKSAPGIPTTLVHVMDIALLEELGGHEPGAYRADPHGVYIDFQRAIGACALDQYLAENPLSMSDRGYGPDAVHGATTGAERIVCDGMAIDSPEAVAEHLERFVFPDLVKRIEAADVDGADEVARLVEGERLLQERLGADILKIPYSGGFQSFPRMRYTQYGYVNYFMAFALYPELMERDFALQADLAVTRNATAARAIRSGELPRMIRLDHDMADSRGTLCDVRTLDAIWFPHFARAIAPLLDAGVRLIWHCDGDLMQMVPRLLECGLGGFQGFQYEDGMDYAAICRMTDRDGGPLLMWAGVSVTTTLPHGTAEDVARELAWLVDNGPDRGLFLGASSSVAPGTNRENVKALVEGLAHYREAGRPSTAARASAR